MDHPDELRVDLDPQPGVEFSTVRRIAARGALGARGHRPRRLARRRPARAGSTCTSGSSPAGTSSRCGGRRWRWRGRSSGGFPDIATSKWWKEERGTRVFLDYNQNARDRTIASVYSVRANPEGKVSCPVTWAELETVNPADLTIATVPDRFAKLGDVARASTTGAFSLEPLLELAARDEAQGLGDAPWPPHFPKQRGEPKRVQPSKARKEPEGGLGHGRGVQEVPPPARAQQRGHAGRGRRAAGRRPRRPLRSPPPRASPSRSARRPRRNSPRRSSPAAGALARSMRRPRRFGRIPSRSRGTPQPSSHAAAGSAPVKTNRWEMACSSSARVRRLRHRTLCEPLVRCAGELDDLRLEEHRDVGSGLDPVDEVARHGARETRPAHQHVHLRARRSTGTPRPVPPSSLRPIRATSSSRHSRASTGEAQ